MLDLARRGAEARVRELAQEIKNLFGFFPDLRDSFDADELPLPFLIAKGAGRATRTAAGERRPTRKRSARG